MSWFSSKRAPASRPSKYRSRRSERGALPRVELLESRDLMSGALLLLHFPILTPIRWPILDPIAAKYQALGGAGGALGKSVSAEVATPYGGGLYEKFQNGAIFYSYATGAHAVDLATENEYFALANAKDAYGNVVEKLLGLPTQDEAGASGLAGAKVTPFQGGNIYWSSATGAHALYGATLAEFAATAGETDSSGTAVQSVLGVPTSDEVNVPGVSGARAINFQGGTIYWSSATGAHAVSGAIGAKYNSLGGATGYGLPTSDEANVLGSPGVRVANFQGGSIYWSSATGAHAVSGAIGSLYQGLGGPTSYLGVPTTDEQAMPGGRMQYCQNGKMWWTPTGGAQAVQAVSQMIFNWDNIDLGNVQGWAQVTLNANGSYNFSGHLHDSSFWWGYKDNVVLGIVSPSGVVFTFAHTGQTAGTIESGSSDDDWNVSGSNSALAAGWADLQGAQMYGHANTSWDVVGNLSAIVTDIQKVAGVVSAIIALV